LVTVPLSTAHASATAAQKCQAGKSTTVGNYVLCRMKAEAKLAAGGASAVYTLARQKCVDKYGGKWTGLETAAAGMCPSNGDQTAIQDLMDECSDEVVTDLGGGSTAEDVGTGDPTADVDLYAWVDGSGNLVIIADFVGPEMPDGGPNWVGFSDDVLYQIHIARGPTSLDDAITYQFRFTTPPPVFVSETTGMTPGQLHAVPAQGLEFLAQFSGAFNQTYSVTKITKVGTQDNSTVLSPPAGFTVPRPNVGPTTDVVTGFTPGETYEQHFIDTAATTTIGTLASGEGRVFAGPRDNPFYADFGSIFDLLQARGLLGLSGGKDLGGSGQQVCTNCTPRDSFRYTNVHAIVLEIPGAIANGGTAVTAPPNPNQTVGVWASASRRSSTILNADGTVGLRGGYQQIARGGIPFVRQMIIGRQAQGLWVRSTPKDDMALFAPYYDNLIAARDAQALGDYGNGAPLQVCNIQNGGPPLTNRLADIIPVLNLAAINPAYTAITSFGDVLRVDLGAQNADFPNGRRLVAGSNVESVDMVDTMLKMQLCTLTNAAVNATFAPNGLAPNTPYGGLPDGVNSNETNYRATFPYLAVPWSGFAASPHAPPAD
jgi:hypothetical protein